MRWAIWWLAIFAAYVVTAEAQVWTEAVAGAVIAAIAVGLAARAFSCVPWDVRARPRSFRPYVSLPARMASDAFRVTGAVLRALLRGERPAGFFARVPFEPVLQNDPFEQGREAIVVYGVSAAPNTVVADVDNRGSLVVHEFVSRPLQVSSERWPL